MESTTSFEEKTFLDFAAAATVMLCTIGERLGLFHAMAPDGAVTPEELARRSGISPRYAQEWLRGMVCAGYVEHSEDTNCFHLSDEQKTVLTTETDPSFMGAHYEALSHLLPGIYEPLLEAFVTGRGIPASAFPAGLWRAQRRGNRGTYERILVQDWIPRVPILQEKLLAGAKVVDVGCGAGEAVISMATAFPSSTFVGLDVVPENIRMARESVTAASLAERVSFDVRDVTTGLGARYDIATAFDVVHDLPDPGAALAAVAQALPEGGLFFVQDTRAAETLRGNHGPVGALMYTISIFHCMTISLGEGGVGLGTLGLPPSTLRSLAAKAGFTAVDEVPIDDPVSALYLLHV